MNVEDLRQACREHSTVILNSLVMQCRQRFLEAAALMEWQTPVVAGVSNLGGRSPVDVWPLVAAYSLACERYISTFYSPQRSLMPTPGGEPDELWCNYIYRELIPDLVARDDVVRNVLRAVGGLPSRSPQEAAHSVYQCCEEMTLPDSPPAWAPAAG